MLSSGISCRSMYQTRLLGCVPAADADEQIPGAGSHAIQRQGASSACVALLIRIPSICCIA